LHSLSACFVWQQSLIGVFSEFEHLSGGGWQWEVLHYSGVNLFWDLGVRGSGWNKFQIFPDKNISLLEAKNLWRPFLVIDSKNVLLRQKFQRNYVYSLYSRYFLHDIRYDNISCPVLDPLRGYDPCDPLTTPLRSPQPLPFQNMGSRDPQPPRIDDAPLTSSFSAHWIYALGLGTPVYMQESFVQPRVLLSPEIFVLHYAVNLQFRLNALKRHNVVSFQRLCRPHGMIFLQICVLF